MQKRLKNTGLDNMFQGLRSDHRKNVVFNQSIATNNQVLGKIDWLADKVNQ